MIPTILFGSSVSFTTIRLAADDDKGILPFKLQILESAGALREQAQEKQSTSLGRYAISIGRACHFGFGCCAIFNASCAAAHWQ